MKYLVIAQKNRPDLRDELKKTAGFLAQSGFFAEEGETLLLFGAEAAGGEGMETLLSGAEAAGGEGAEVVFPTSRAYGLRCPEGDVDGILSVLAAHIGDAEFVLLPTGDWGAEMAVRLAKRTGGTALTGVERVTFRDGCAAAFRRTGGGHLLAEYEMKKKPFCLSLSNLIPAAEPAGATALLGLEAEGASDRLYDGVSNKGCRILSKMPVERSASLESADLLLAAGRGLRSKAGAEKLERFAEALGAAFGGSRPVIMNAWLPHDRLIGVSGAMPSPKVTIALAVSGSPAFFSGIEKSGVIVAVNRDPDAPIMKKADLAVEEDWETFLKALEKCVNEREG